MTVYSRYPLTEQVSLRLVPSTDIPAPAELFDNGLEVLGALRDVVHACALDLWLACRPLEVPFVINDPEPCRPAWRIAAECKRCDTEANLPERPSVDVLIHSELEDGTLRSWFQRAMDQATPDPRFPLTIREFSSATVATRIIDVDALDDQRTAWVEAYGDELIAVSTVATGDGLWLPASVVRPGFTPPVMFAVTFEDGVVTAYISVRWSRWTEPGTGEHRELETALRKLVRAGWAPHKTRPWLDLNSY